MECLTNRPENAQSVDSGVETFSGARNIPLAAVNVVSARESLRADLPGTIVAMSPVETAMSAAKEFHVLVASDGSLPATAATVTAAHFPWPKGTHASGVVSRETGTNEEWRAVRAALEQSFHSTAETTAKALARRWPDARVRVIDGPPASAIVRAAKRRRADVIVMGWRGHGTVRRLLAGSVSRDVVRAAPCSVLVVRRAVRSVTNIVIGVDGSEQSARAVELVRRLPAPRGGRILLVTAAPLMSDPSHPLLPAAVRRTAASGVATINRTRKADARANLVRLANGLRAAGWRVDVAIPDAAPLRALLAAVTRARADLLVVGATGTSQLARLLLGSVAHGALDRSPVPVLIVR
jgi:nucleotide-binding universal stress UspA family protein